MIIPFACYLCSRMKKAVIAITALLYFAVTSGMVINLHYCMDRFTSADIGYSMNQRLCNKCGMDKSSSNGCCHDETRLVKLQDDQNKALVLSFDFSNFQAPATIPASYIQGFLPAPINVKEVHLYKPPLRNMQQTYLQISVLRV